MSISINSLTFTGRVGSIFAVKKYNGSSLLEFTVAVRSNYKNKSGEYDTQWFRCKIWDKPEGNYVSLMSSQLVKGSAVTVCGQLEFDPQTGGPRLYLSKDGTMKSDFSVVCRDVVVQSPRQTNVSVVASDRNNAPARETEGDMFDGMDDIPW